jgi:RNA-directed DNA polymerase
VLSKSRTFSYGGTKYCVKTQGPGTSMRGGKVMVHQFAGGRRRCFYKERALIGTAYATYAMPDPVGTEGTPDQQSPRRTQSRESVTQVLDRIRQAARSGKGEKFTSLFHHISPEMLMTADYALSRKAAAGVDGMTWAEYGQDLEARLLELHERVQQGRYVPQPSRRTYILKADGRQRPLAVAALEDNAGCSGRRDRRTQGEFHRRRRHPELLRFCQPRLACQIRGHRIGDRRIVRLIGKWLRAGILEDGTVMVSETGTGQGSVISPLLANIYLHGVLDLWAQRWRRREATGDMIIVRFERASDASRFLDAMRARLEGFSLSLHPDKTRLIEFGRYPELSTCHYYKSAEVLGKPPGTV